MTIAEIIVLCICAANTVTVTVLYRRLAMVARGKLALAALLGDSALVITCTYHGCKNGVARTCKNGQCPKHCEEYCSMKCRVL